MIAKALYAVAVVLFVVAVANNADLELVVWGLAALAGGHVVGGVTP